jgi:hypothetical protein
MRVFKNKAVSKWVAKEGLTDRALLEAVGEMELGLIDADLGGHMVKKRVALAGRGKAVEQEPCLPIKWGIKHSLYMVLLKMLVPILKTMS